VLRLCYIALPFEVEVEDLENIGSLIHLSERRYYLSYEFGEYV
jgi:hypothetical protein